MSAASPESASLSAFGDIQGGIAQSNAAGYAAQVAENNAKIATQNATYSTLAGQTLSQQLGLRTAGTVGQIKASQAANNVDVNSGSAVNVQVSQRETGELDALTAMNNATLQAYGYKTQATNYLSQAAIDKAKGEQSLISGALGALGASLQALPSLGSAGSGAGAGQVSSAGDASFSGGSAGAAGSSADSAYSIGAASEGSSAADVAGFL